MLADDGRAAGDLWLYPEHGLGGRLMLAYAWIPEGAESLLDAGCSYGYGTRFFARRAARTVGIDPNPEFIALARRRYPHIRFEVAGTEAIPFHDRAFDVVVMADVLEHVANERRTLDEVYRVLTPGGTLILTVPHKGCFGFLDVDNLSLRLRRSVPRLHAFLYRLRGLPRPERRPGYDDWHRHYSYRELLSILEGTRFATGYRVEGVKRTGLFLELLLSLVYQTTRVILGPRAAARVLVPFQTLAALDYRISYGALAANLAVRLTKTAETPPPHVRSNAER